MASSSGNVPSVGTVNDDANFQSDEVAIVKAANPNRCRVTYDVGQYKKVVTLQPENLDATIKFHLTAAYPSVIPEIKIRSESLSDDDIHKLQDHLKKKAQELIGKEMIQPLMEETKTRLKALGIRPGKVKHVHSETFIDSISKSKRNRNKKKSKSEFVEEKEEGKLPSMKTAENVINRIIWDDNLDADLFLVGYIDRFRGLMEKYFNAFSWEDLATVDYDVLAIPKHRIQYFKYKDVKVWDKTKRMDNVFGSANGTKTIDVVMNEVEETEQQQRQDNVNNSATPTSKSSSDEDDDDSDDDFITVTINSSVNIGISKGVSERDGKDRNEDQTEKNAINPYWTDKLRPNYFLCVRIADQSIIDGIGNMQDNILQREPLLAECCISGASLHVTICTLGLDTAEQLLQCMETLKKMKSELCNVLPKSVLQVKGVSNFYERVAYGKVHYEKDFLEFCDVLKMNLREAGVQIRDGYEFVPHVTIMKVTRPVARVRGTKYIDPKYYEKFVDTEFGEQAVESLYLCSMGDERRPDGFYRTPYELHFQN